MGVVGSFVLLIGDETGVKSVLFLVGDKPTFRDDVSPSVCMLLFDGEAVNFSDGEDFSAEFFLGEAGATIS